MQDDPDLEAAYALTSPEDNRRLYAAWAESYDQDFAENLGYLLPEHVARAFAEQGGQGLVIDLGAGTGLLGTELNKLGIGPVEATDISQQMLDVAAGKALYSRLFVGDLLDQLPVENARYAGAVSSGTFTNGHVGPEALDEVLRIVRPGGIISLSINAVHWQAKGFEAKFEALADQVSDLTLQEVRIYKQGSTGPHADDLSQIVTFTRQ